MNICLKTITDISLVQSYGDALAFGTIICDSHARILYANDAAEVLARSRAGIVFQAKSRSLSATQASDQNLLMRHIVAACDNFETGSMSLMDASRAPVVIVLVTPMPSRHESLHRSGHALVAVRCLNGGAHFDEARLATLFKLSPAQASLALALYEGKSFEEIASTRNVKVSTLRTHFSEVLNRTGSTGLRDLTRRLGLIPPLR